MKLIKMSVDNFRGISGGLSRNSINFEDISSIFVFGQNNVGKTSFLKAYEVFYHNLVSADDYNREGDNIIRNVNISSSRSGGENRTEHPARPEATCFCRFS